MLDTNPLHITINMDKLQYNIEHSYSLCQEHGIELAAVIKSICADDRIMNIFNNSSVTTIADSRVENLSRLETNKTKLLIRPAAIQQCNDVVKYCDISFVTSMELLVALETAAQKQGKKHGVLIMIDIGDLRDGIMFSDTDEMLRIAKYAHESSYITLSGIATNYNCFLGCLPDSENMTLFAELSNMLVPYYDVDRPIISGGNSSSAAFLLKYSQGLPSTINQFRMGEAIMLGRDPSDNTFIEGYATDVFTLYVPLIEIHEKPIKNTPSTNMRRGILSIGKQDLQIEHLIPKDPNVTLLGGCSDECVIDLTNATDYKVGDLMAFELEYGALMSAFAGSFIRREYI